MIYEKQPLTIEDQIKQLKARGLEIPDETIAYHYLANISYYRLAGYWWPMQADRTNHIFKPNSRFDDVIALYNFDRELRVLFFDVIERIEIGLRSKMIYHLSLEYDAWWFQKPELFENTREYFKTLASIEEELDR